MPSNFWDTYYGGGYGAGQGNYTGGVPSNPNGVSGYQPPKSAGQPQSSTNSSALAGFFGGSGGSNVIDWARLGYAIYKDKNPTKPKFEQPPLTPEQKQLWDLYLKGMMNPALKNNAANTNAIGQQVLSGYQNMSWQAPKNKDGSVAGYAGSNTSFTPPWGPQGQSATPPPQTLPNGGQIAPGGLSFGGGGGLGVGEEMGRNVQHRMQDSGDMPMGVMEEINMMSRGMFNDPMNQVHAGNATGDPNWAPTPWPAGTGPNAQPDPLEGHNQIDPNWKPSDADGKTRFQEFVEFLTSKGVVDAAKVAVLFFMGRAPEAIGTGVRALYQAYQRSKNSGQPQPAGGKP